ncbi:MAG: hypothetical protein QM710_09860 [Flavobacterium sp.]
MKTVSAIILNLLFATTYSQIHVTTKKDPVSFNKHGITITDNYSWLENAKSPEVLKWVEAENEITSAHLGEINKKEDFEKKIRKFDLYQTNSLPNKSGKYYYSEYIVKRDCPSSLFYRKKLDDYPTELVSLNRLYPGSKAVFKGYFPSLNSTVLAYKVSPDGSDNHEIRFVDINKKENLADALINVRYSNVAWNLDQGVFYKKNLNTNKIAIDSTNQLFYHKLGTGQDEDKLVFESKTGSTFRHYTTRGKLIIIEKNEDENAV